jgi:hypothetical protein
LQATQAQAQGKACKRAYTFPTPRKIIFKIPFPSKIFKSTYPQPTQKQYADSEILIRHDFQETADRTPAGNSGFAKAGDQCFG